MVLFTLLALILIVLAVITVFTIVTVGAGAIVIFGDVIVCGVFIGIILRYILKKRKKRK